MGDLYLTLLGPPEVRHADQLLLFSTRKELALLIYLAVEGRLHARKTLSEQFWPEGDARHGRAALRITLRHLRHLLFEGADVSPVPHLRSRPRPLYPPRSLHVGACVDPHLSDHARRGTAPDGRAHAIARPLDHPSCAGDRASLHPPGASVRTERGVEEGSGGLYDDARARTRRVPACDGERRPEPPGGPGCTVVLLPGDSTGATRGGMTACRSER